MARDWRAWHRAYDDPASALSARLGVVVDVLRDALHAAPPGPIRLVSLCSGDARDIALALTDHPRRDDVVGCVVELDPTLAEAAAENLRAVGSHLAVRRADAGDPGVISDVLPADVLMLVGIFGNIDDADVERLIATVPAICRRGATVIWTRHRREADLTPDIAGWFAEAGCTSMSFHSPGPGSFAVGSERLERPTPGRSLPTHLFTFRDDFS